MDELLTQPSPCAVQGTYTTTPCRLRPGWARVPLRSPTLPPATHTNTYVLGEQRFTVFDPACPWPDEQAVLYDWLEASGGVVERIVLTHHHPDHVGGAMALQRWCAERGRTVPICAHPATAQRLVGEVVVQEALGPGQVLSCDGVQVQAVFTPGHAPGHLVFHDAVSGWVVSGDMVAAVGTIVLLPEDGTLAEYLASLKVLRARQPVALLPSHGGVVGDPAAKLTEYLDHRHHRTDQVRTALQTQAGASPVRAIDLVAAVYGPLPEPVVPLAALQITSHLIWLEGRGEATSLPGAFWKHRTA